MQLRPFIIRHATKVPVTIAIALAAIAVAALNVNEALQFDRTSLAAGEVWRLATEHVTHWNAEHLQWDLLMFIVLGGACEL
jgi:hypothetical protein